MTKPSIPRLISVAALIWACCSAANADTFKVVTPPGPGQEPSIQPGSTFKVVNAPISGQPLPNPSIQVVNAPQGVHTAADMPQTDEPLPGEDFNSNPPVHNSPVAVTTRPRQRCSNNEATLPCSVIQQVVLSPGTGRQIDFGRSFARVVPSNSEVIDVLPINDHEMFIKPSRQTETVTQSSGSNSSSITASTVLRRGNSDIFVYDKDSNRIGVIEVTIDDFAFKKNVPVTQDQLAGRASTIEIYHGTKLREPFPYRCAPEIGGCYYVGAGSH